MIYSVDVSKLTTEQVIDMSNTIYKFRHAIRIMEDFHVPPLTATVIAHIKPRQESKGFVNAVHAYVWGNDPSKLTDALRKNCDDILRRIADGELQTPKAS